MTMYLDHLVRMPDTEHSPFDNYILESKVLFDELSMFAQLPAPTLIYQHNLAFKNLFIFLAVRFQAAPETVIDCERCHAQWKCLEISKRGISLKLLNGLLKLRYYDEQYNGFPDNAVIQPYYSDVTAGLMPGRNGQAQLCITVMRYRFQT